MVNYMSHTVSTPPSGFFPRLPPPPSFSLTSPSFSLTSPSFSLPSPSFSLPSLLRPSSIRQSDLFCPEASSETASSLHLLATKGRCRAGGTNEAIYAWSEVHHMGQPAAEIDVEADYMGAANENPRAGGFGELDFCTPTPSHPSHSSRAIRAEPWAE